MEKTSDEIKKEIDDKFAALDAEFTVAEKEIKEEIRNHKIEQIKKTILSI